MTGEGAPGEDVPDRGPAGFGESLQWVGDLTVAVSQRRSCVGYISLVGPVFVAYIGSRQDQMVELAQRSSFTAALTTIRAAQAANTPRVPEPDAVTWRPAEADPAPAASSFADPRSA